MGSLPLSNTICIADSSAGQPHSVSKTMRLALLRQFSAFSRSFPFFRHIVYLSTSGTRMAARGFR
jgi:hypothetical protein